MSPPSTSSPDPDQIESADGGIGASIGRILKLLARPELKRSRPVMALAVLLTLTAAIIDVLSPLVIGAAINVIAGDTPGGVTYGCLLYTSPSPRDA